MNPDLHQDITRRLLDEFKFKERGKWLREGECPSCHKKELYTNAEEPWVVRCGREAKCAWSSHVKDLYPDAFNSWSERYKPTDNNPNAAADAYLQYGRGFKLELIKGLYEQADYYDPEKKIGSATVRFPLSGGGYWERLIDKPERFGKKKARFNFGGGYQGTWWGIPGRDISKASEVWITEGIFDTLALIHNGIESVSAMSCNNFPEKALQELATQCSGERPALVWALDADPAARRYTRKWVEKAEAMGWRCRAAQITQPAKGKLDWNELHQRNQLNDEALDEARYNGDLLLAKSPGDKALIMYRHRERQQFPFEFNHRLYWFNLDLGKYDKAVGILRESDKPLSDAEIREQALKDSGTVVEVANCHPQPLYFQANRITDESWYYFRIEFPNGSKPVKSTFTGGQLASSPEFKKRLISIAAGAMWEGNSKQLDRFIRDQMSNIRTVETVDFIGYAKEHGCWIFGNLAVKDGNVITLNDDDYFDMDKVSIKSLSRSLALNINPAADAYQNNWLPIFWDVYGHKGLIALAFWFGTLFVEQIRSRYKSYPFLEMVGQHGAGKTTLVKFLWKLLGRGDYEGFNPSTSTKVAQYRNFVQVSSLPVVLVESDSDEENKAKRFNWEDLKPAYNGNALRSLGVKTAGNETYEPPFRASIVIEQNQPVNASQAILSRIVQMHFDQSGHTTETYQLAKKLEAWPLDELSHFILLATTKEQDIMNVIAERVPLYESQFQANPKIREFRISLNHAMVMALLDALTLVVPLTDHMRNTVLNELMLMAEKRQEAINDDHPMVQEFWEVYDYLNGSDADPRLNHSRDEGLIAINLNHFYEKAEHARQKLPPISELKRHLKTSRKRPFLDMRVVNSRIFTNQFDSPARSVRCWIFKNPKKGDSQ